MNKLEIILETYPDETFVKADGLDEAVIGVEIPSMRLCYSVTKVIEILMIDDEMEIEDAIEHFEYNIRGGYVGEQTPIWVDTNFEVGFNENWFDLVDEFNPKQFAMSIIRLMLFPKSKGFTKDDIIKAKAYAHLVIETVKGNCENDNELNQVQQIKEVIDKINQHDFND